MSEQVLLDYAFCNNCEWCHFEVSTKYVADWIKKWKKCCKEWSEEKLALYGIKNRKPPSPISYLRCFLCGNDYRDFNSNGKAPEGSTISPILRRQDVWPPKKRKKK